MASPQSQNSGKIDQKWPIIPPNAEHGFAPLGTLRHKIANPPPSLSCGRNLWMPPLNVDEHDICMTKKSE